MSKQKTSKEGCSRGFKKKLCSRQVGVRRRWRRHREHQTRHKTRNDLRQEVFFV